MLNFLIIKETLILPILKDVNEDANGPDSFGYEFTLKTYWYFYVEMLKFNVSS